MDNEITIKNELLYFPKDNTLHHYSIKKKLHIELCVIFDIDYFSIEIYADDNNVILYHKNINDCEELDIGINKHLEFDIKDFSGNGSDYINFIKSIKENKNSKLNLLFSGYHITIFHKYDKHYSKSTFSIFSSSKNSDQKTISKYNYFELHDSEKEFLDYFKFENNKILLNYDLK